MADLQDIDLEQEPAIDEHPFHRCLGVSREEGTEPSVAKDHHDRAVVDVALGQGCRRIGVAGVENLDPRQGVERERCALSGEGDVEHRLGWRFVQEMVVRWILECDPGMQERPDSKAVEHVDEPGDVVLVRVAQHQHVDPPREERQVRPEPTQREPGVGPAVDQHRGAARRLHQDRVALSDVEHGQVQATIGPGRDGNGEEDRGQGCSGGQRSEQTHRQGWAVGERIRGASVVGWVVGAKRPRRQPDDRQPRGGEGGRQRHVDRRVRDGGDTASERDDDSQNQPRAAAREPGTRIAHHRDVEHAVHETHERRDGAEEHRQGHEGDDEHVGQRGDE